MTNISLHYFTLKEMLIDNENVLHLPTCIKVPISEDLLKELVERAKDWAIMNGAVMRSRIDFNPDTVQFAPFVLFPSVLRADDFNTLVSIQSIFNEIIHKVAYNKEFLKKSLSNTILVDEFTRNLYNIYEIVESEGVVQPLTLGLVRCDWMLKFDDANSSHLPHLPPSLSDPQCRWRQVEINTIAAGFGWLGPVSKNIHKYILEELGQYDKIKHLPENNALRGLCDGLLGAWKLYGNPKAVILFVIEDITYNICDQRFHEYEIRRTNSNAIVIRKTLTEIANKASLSREKKLIIDKFEVAVIYFRAGYHPDHYPSEKEWDARLLMERSMAIKCPTIHYHLAGTKKVQQELAKPGALEMFLEKNQTGRIRELFVDLYGLEFDELGETAIQMALKEPDRFVLKPQREGGGNNLYGIAIKEAILKMKDSQERTAWILMERIRPPITQGYIIRPDGPNPPPLSEMVSELGIFGMIIGDRKTIIVNRQVGHMLRTKLSTANEGGVAAGDGALDSPFLIND